MKLQQMQTLTATLELVTGLHIGGGDNSMHIGGIDSPVIKQPLSQLPYIPGSSLKGKMRSLLEWRAGMPVQTQGQPLSYSQWERLNDDFGRQEGELILQLFGIGGSDKLTPEQAIEIGPTRLAFWDCNLSQSWLDEQENGYISEEKSENAIDRLKGVAKNPRFIERVPAGARFDFRLTLKQFDSDDEHLLDTLLRGIKLLELDGIGGSGSRGYGKIRFLDMSLDGQLLDERLANLKAL